MSENDRDYFRKRAEQELKAVEEAHDQMAANVHKVLAARYSLLADHASASQVPGEVAASE